MGNGKGDTTVMGGTGKGMLAFWVWCARKELGLAV